MKAVAFDRTDRQQLASPPAVTLIADSAFVTNGNPVFVPDFSNLWSAQIYLAFRICRLGKGISAKFAPRYRDSVALAMKLVPPDIKENLIRTQLPTGILGLFDNCVAIGPWQPLPTDGQLNVGVRGTTTQLSVDSSQIDNAIELISHYSILKMGDAIMPVRLPVEFAVGVGDTLEATLNGDEVLNLRFK